jgi:hypothetical protein
MLSYASAPVILFSYHVLSGHLRGIALAVGVSALASVGDNRLRYGDLAVQTPPLHRPVLSIADGTFSRNRAHEASPDAASE